MLIGLVVLVMLLATAFVVIYKKLEGNIATAAMPDGVRPTEVVKGPLNVLVMGSDTRAGANGVGIGGSTPGLSDTTMLLHLSADRKFAYGVSLPRDAMVIQPPCKRKDGNGVDPGGLIQFNAAFAIGGPTCTVKTVEHLTNIRIDHFVVVDFVGFRSMVDAIGGVTMCVPSAVNDTVGHIQLPAGTYKMNGQQALDYVRVRHDLGAPTGDIGRMKRQQSFISAMIKKVVSAGTLVNPFRLLSFLNAATNSLTTDPAFANLQKLASLGSSLQSVGLDHIKFITVPWQPYPPDTNRVEWAPTADGLWSLIRNDKRLTSEFTGDAVGPQASSTPSGSATGTPTGKATHKATGSSTPSSTPTQTQAEKDAQAQANGLCTSSN